MKLRKSIFVLIFVLCLTLILGNLKEVKAETSISKTFVITHVSTEKGLDDKNWGYALGDPNANGTTATSANIWNIVEYTSKTAYKEAYNVYCVKAGVGFSSTKNSENYDISYDMKTESSTIASKNDVLSALVNGGHYNELLALTDLLYIRGVSTEAEKTALLENAGIYVSQGEFSLSLSDDDIEAVQQAAIWHFTNYGETAYDKYNSSIEDNSSIFTYTLSEDGSSYTALSDYDQGNKTGEQRSIQANRLYKYLIETATTNSNNTTTKSKNKLTLYASTTNNLAQPLMVIERESENEEFDLALRKYITKVNDVELTDSRVPEIDTSSLNNGETTATYKHRKDPVEIKNGDIVTYSITVYNEGDIAGRATKIVDQLPTGLEFVQVVSGNFELDSYDSTGDNKLTLKRVTDNKTNLNAYNGTTLASETIEIQCKVVATNKTTQILTNVAWISEEVKANDDGTETTIVNDKNEDRDSEPGTIPNVNKDNMSDYTGNTNNKNDLTDKDYYYEGEQDDDDFEKLIIKAENEFDLALRKYITKLNGVVLTDTRIPNIDKTSLDNGTTATYKHRKDPVTVVTGDVVTYSITIYNEGDIAGRATKIVDQLPTGLEFVQVVSGNFELDSYDKTGDNRLTLKRITTNNSNLEPYDGTILASETIEIECKVVAVADTQNKKVLTNVAWISEEVKANTDGTETTIVTDKDVDRDSEPGTTPNVNKDNMSDYKGNTGNKDDLTDKDYYYKGEQDDDDFEKLVIEPIKQKEFDLKLIKRITEVNGEKVTERIKNVDITKLANGSATTADYTLDKTPVSVKQGDLVKYTFRIYNEGEIDGYASEITEDIPEGLQFVWSEKTGTDLENDKTLTSAEKEAIKFNQEIGWVLSDDLKTVSTDYLAKGKGAEISNEGANLIKAFDATKSYSDITTNKNPDYKEVSIILKVVAENSTNSTIRNEACISGATDEDGKSVTDRDSKPDEWVKYEDDEDYDNIILQQFDLSLRKFITKVNDEAVTTRIPTVTYDEKTTNKFEYTHSKTPVEVTNGDIVVYTIRVYNEGTADGYAAEITDDMPEGLEYLPSNSVNKQYGWVMLDKNGKETSDVSEAVKIVTDYLSKENGEAMMSSTDTENPNLLKAYDSTKGVTSTNPDYRDVKVAFKVTEPATSSRILVNAAQISKDTDENGNEVDDIDSKPGEWNDGEDDQDNEYVKLTYFDLALRKWVTQAIVIEDGKQTVTNTGHDAWDDPEQVVKVELNRKKLSSVTVKFKYSIRVYNQGTIAGYAKEITDYVPEGLKFVASDNPNWTDEGNNVISTKALENTLLQPGEYADVEVLLTWESGEKNIGLKTNVAEISEDYNDKNAPDIDSTPDNNKDGEDDIDDAPVLLSIATGKQKVYLGLACVVLITTACGIILIKRFVL